MDYFETGFCVRQPSWHRKETLLDDYPADADEARLRAGLMWEPGYRDIYVEEVFEVGAELPEGSHVVGMTDTGDQVVHVPQGGHQAIVRNDTRATLAVPRTSWQLISNEQMFELLDEYTKAWRAAGATVQFETAGSVKGGALVWALVKLDEPYTVPGDDSETYPFATILNAHDGSAACRLTPTQVRVVCWNTWKAAEYDAERSGMGIVLRHNGNMADKLAEAKVAATAMRDEAKAWQLQATDLAGFNYGDAAVERFLDGFIPLPDGATERMLNSRAEKQAMFRSLLASPTNCELPDTAYKLVQAAGEYLDHVRPFRSSDTYLARTMLAPEPFKAGAIRLAREVCNA